MPPAVRVELSDQASADVEADLLCVGLFDGEELPEDLNGRSRRRRRQVEVQEPLDAPARASAQGPGRRARQARRVRRRARPGGGGARPCARRPASTPTSIAWDCPPEGAGTPAGIAAGTILASYSFDRYKSGEDDDEPGGKLELLTLLGASDAERIVEVARVAAEAANRARELQNLPANVCDPAFLSDRAAEIVATNDSVELEVLGPERLESEGMGGILAVTAGLGEGPGADRAPLLAAAATGPTLGLVGKGVTFDSGGISIKPAAGMQLMKKDMSGGAAVLEATAAIAELGLPIDVVAVVPAVENMLSGTATRPGDIITQLNGKTVEINNTDAEGRLILADALTWCVAPGGRADRRRGDADRRRGRRARLDLRRGDLQRRRLGGGGHARPATSSASCSGGCPSTPSTRQLTKGDGRRPDQRRGEARGGDDLRGLVPRGVRRRRHLGAPRHRRDVLGRGPRVRRQGRDRLRHAAAGRAGEPHGYRRLRERCRRRLA